MPSFYTEPPTPPTRNNPSNFNALADDFFSWLAVAAAEYNELDLYRGNRYAGMASAETPNNITVEGFELWNGFMFNGYSFTFAVEAENYGPFTITLAADGVARATRTPTGAELPAGYLKPGNLYTARYNLGYWQISRPVERITNANGTALRFEDGTQFCYHQFTSSGGVVDPTGAIFSSSDENWTFPAEFASTVGLVIRAGTSGSGRWANTSSIAVSNVMIRQFVAVSNGGVSVLRLIAIGRWY